MMRRLYTDVGELLSAFSEEPAVLEKAFSHLKEKDMVDIYYG